MSKMFRNLYADEIDVKVGSVNSKGYTVLLYKNARVDMNILDEKVGNSNWQNKFYEVCGNLYCSLGIKIDNEWIWKDDCGVESAFGDKEKGQASDARKRAGVVWGIGRELYTAPFMFIPCETEQDGKSYKIKNYADRLKSSNLKVTEIEYNDKDEITKVVVCDNSGNVVFSNKKSESKTENKAEFRFKNGKYAGKTLRDVFEVDKGYLEWCLGSNINQELKSLIEEFLNANTNNKDTITI